ncbi:hypothetical protein CIL05_12710 [Virgibacillus profundi]|uniref:Uncharacterized protein n=1 Tax=Virgibacillus profundi TaxID=2024555 RepID=A0A2A2IB73_9BACI|nr:hypothetical protein [Virgibacillus profundi]PAV29251.1 hypothetical protein CIL05_12710 [Virgibacillus profundi]PXY53420.1 hypothetical protein CIT14_12835 [Virgibacillus profundi]
MGATLLTIEEELAIKKRMRKFRGYSKATAGGGSIVKSTGGGGGTVKSTSSGGASTQTSSSGGGTSKSTESGGSTTVTSTTKIFPKEVLQISSGPSSDSQSEHTHLVNISGDGRFDHAHSVSVPAHSHSFNVPNHVHSVSIPAHTHDIDLPNHTHEIELPNHVHEIIHGIFLLEDKPTDVEIRVDGNLVNFSGTNGDRINLIDYIEKDSNGKITRGKHEVTLLPNERGRIEAQLITRLFIRSHIGGNY